MKDFFQKLLRKWRLLAPNDQRLLVFWLVLIVFLSAKLLSLPAPSKVEVLTKAPSESTETLAAEPTEFKLPAESFKAKTLTTLYQSGKWDGEPLRSYDGNHLATIDDSGMLIIDGKEEYCYPDIPEGYSCDGIYRDALSGTYACFRYDYTDLSNAFMCFKRGEKIATYELPVAKADSLVYWSVRLKYVLLLSSVSEHALIRFDPHQDDDAKFEVLSDEIGPIMTKISETEARFVVTTLDPTTNRPISSTIYSVGETGPLQEIATVDNVQRVRAITDYPNQGDPAEFWLARTAYVKGVWDGSTTKFSNLAAALNLDLTKQPTDEPLNLRAPELNRLDYSKISPDSLVSLHRWSHGSRPGACIMVDNLPKYYLHATAPWLVDDITYRKVENFGYQGFVEIDSALQSEYHNYRGEALRSEPACLFSLAVSPDDLAAEGSHDLTSVIIPLPYHTYAETKTGVVSPADFLQNLELIDAVNYDKGLRAVAIGYYGTSDSEADAFTLYLSRKNSLFEPVATGVTEAHFFSEYSTDYIQNENNHTAAYDSVGLWLHGQYHIAAIDDVFRFDNTLSYYDD